VINAVAEDLRLTNIKTSHKRAEDIDERFDFILG
jgi:16S rRNA (guanine527-N7)-methyltransferase